MQCEESDAISWGFCFPLASDTSAQRPASLGAFDMVASGTNIFLVLVLYHSSEIEPCNDAVGAAYLCGHHSHFQFLAQTRGMGYFV